jgi:para-nitrobenzyl esterase
VRRTVPAIALIAILWAAASPAATLPDPISVEGGQVSGTNSWGFGVRMYRGIPFAAPPVGVLRWRAPQPVPAWSGVRKADHFSAACMQEARPKFTAAWNTGINGYSEDCLYLNIWTPAHSASEALPVMVWIYGGGGREGSGGEPLYDPSNLAKRGVVVVSFNYRVNVFGWMAHPELTTESAVHASGNYGALDQIAALRWVHANIAAFGGDPAKVTIFGESGGSRSVNWVLASPLSKGLVRAAIAQSHTVFGAMESLAHAEGRGNAFAASVRAANLADLRAMSAEELMAAYLKHPEGMNAAIVDGYFLPADIRTIYARGQQTDVPLLTGGDHDEPGGPAHPGGVPQSADQYHAWVTQAYGEQAQRLLELYPARRDAEVKLAYTALQRDANYAGHLAWAQYQLKTGHAPVWLYLFSYPVPEYAPDGKQTLRAGSPHGSEVPYMFDNLRYADRPWDAQDQQLATMLADYWVNFAVKLDPNGSGLPKWPAYSAASTLLLDIAAQTKARPLLNPAGLELLEGREASSNTAN